MSVPTRSDRAASGPAPPGLGAWRGARRGCCRRADSRPCPVRRRLPAAIAIAALELAAAGGVSGAAVTAAQPAPPPAAAGHPDLDRIPLPVVDVFEPAVARQLEQARAVAAELLAAGDGRALDALGTLCGLYLRYELLDAAGPCLEQARSAAPRDFRWAYLATYLYTRTADLARAREAAAAALQLRPDDLPALLRSGDLHLLGHELDAAEAAFAAALAKRPESAAAHLGLGRVALARDDPAAAVPQLEAALQGQPEGSIVHYHLGMAYRALGDLDRAREHLGRSRQVEVAFDDPLIAGLERLSESREAVFVHGVALLQRGDAAGAAAAFERVLEQDPDDAQAHYNLARAEIEQGDLELAERHLRRALELWPEFYDAHLNLAILLGRTGRSDQAKSHLERAAAIDPEHVPTRLLLAQVLREGGETDRARDQLETVLRLEPSSTEARLALAALEAGAGDPAAARRQYRRVLATATATDQQRVEAHRRLALLPGTAAEEAIVELGRALELEPDAVAIRGALAEILARSGRLEQAERELARLVELAPGDPRVALGLATTRLLAGRYAAAASVLEEALRQAPDDLALRHLEARFLATCPDAALRDGTRALGLAQGLVERQLTVDHVETLAMALAETGRFDDAATWQRRALERRRATGAPTAAGERWLELYLARREVRAPWAEPTAASPARRATP